MQKRGRLHALKSCLKNIYSKLIFVTSEWPWSCDFPFFFSPVSTCLLQSHLRRLTKRLNESARVCERDGETVERGDVTPCLLISNRARLAVAGGDKSARCHAGGRNGREASAACSQNASARAWQRSERGPWKTESRCRASRIDNGVSEKRGGWSRRDRGLNEIIAHHRGPLQIDWSHLLLSDARQNIDFINASSFWSGLLECVCVWDVGLSFYQAKQIHWNTRETAHRLINKLLIYSKWIQAHQRRLFLHVWSTFPKVLL